MARMRLTLDGRTEAGGSPIVLHNPRLADPLSPFSLAIGRLSGKRKKTEVDHVEIALLEFVGSLYHDASDEWLGKRNGKDVHDDLDVQFFESGQFDPLAQPYLPVWNIIRCIQEAGKRHKLGISVLEAVSPVTIKAPLVYDGPTEIDALWRDGRFAFRNSVGIRNNRTMRTRPIFVDWYLEADVEVDLTILDPDKVDQLLQEGGRYKRVGDYRALYGSFHGAARLVEATPGATKDAEATA